MRRILKILIFSFVVFIMLLGWGYALVPPVKGFVDNVVVKYAGDTAIGIWNSSPVQTFIVPWPNQFLLGMMFMIPLAWVWHKHLYNRVRGWGKTSVDTESGGMIVQQRPISQQTVTPQPKTTTKAKAPEPTPEPTPKREPTTETEEAET